MGVCLVKTEKIIYTQAEGQKQQNTCRDMQTVQNGVSIGNEGHSNRNEGGQVAPDASTEYCVRPGGKDICP